MCVWRGYQPEYSLSHKCDWYVQYTGHCLVGMVTRVARIVIRAREIISAPCSYQEAASATTYIKGCTEKFCSIQLLVVSEFEACEKTMGRGLWFTYENTHANNV